MKGAALVVRRRIRATPERLFEAWTDSRELLAWWGPGQVRCIEAEIDLRIGGAYRLLNLLPDGRTLPIEGEFEVVAPPSKLVYTWRSPASAATERVTVTFERDSEFTEVVVMHEHLATAEIRVSHEQGWTGCLGRLADYVAGL